MMLLVKIDTSKQLADIFTKPLAYAQFIGCVRRILGDPDAMRQTKVLRQLCLPLRGVWALTSSELPWAVPDGPT